LDELNNSSKESSPQAIGWLNALENLFVLGEGQSGLSPLVSHSPSVQSATSGGFAAIGAMTTEPLETENWSFQSFLSRSWHKVVAQVTPAMSEVVVVKARRESALSSEADMSSQGRGFWRCPMPLKATTSTQVVSAEKAQIWVRGCFVAELPTESQAKAMARNWQKVLHIAGVDFSQLEPAMINGMPGGRLNDRVLFTVPTQLASKLNASSEQLAINWVNNLRIALNRAPLSQAQAQARLRRLVETGEVISGLASWYGPYFDGNLTATGEIFNQDELTAAHLYLPFNTYLRVTNLENGKSVIVRINDRGPYLEDRVLDLSREAARRLNAENTGVVPIEAVVMKPESVNSSTQGQKFAQRF
jgi:rare lipoprotein A